LKVVILAGGLGTRISEESRLRPKPMVWRIMKISLEEEMRRPHTPFLTTHWAKAARASAW